jgi:hypothetical protein
VKLSVVGSSGGVEKPQRLRLLTLAHESRADKASISLSRIESLAAELMMMIAVIDDCYCSALYCSCRVLPLGPDYSYISIS